MWWTAICSSSVTHERPVWKSGMRCTVRAMRPSMIGGASSSDGGGALGGTAASPNDGNAPRDDAAGTGPRVGPRVAWLLATWLATWH